MAAPRLSKLEFEIMETFWSKGECSIRGIPDSRRQAKPGLYDHPDHREPDGGQGSCAARQEGGKRLHLRGLDLPSSRAAAAHRRPAGPVWIAVTDGDGAPNRIRQAFV